MKRSRAPRLSLDLLRGFCAAARTLSFTLAARELFVTQSAISREIKTLEEQLGQPLFRRVNRTLQLTHAGAELHRTAQEALAAIDATTTRLTSSGGLLAVTTTTALASAWLVPRLPRFARRHPELDVRVAASNDMVDLDREHLDVAVRFVPVGETPSGGEHLVDYETFPVCAPALARDRRRPLRTPADLAHHVRLDFEAVLYGRLWYDWDRWADMVKVGRLRPASTLRFSHYDQVIEAAIDGAGVAIGKRPHLVQHLRDGRLVAPFGHDWVAPLGRFDIVTATGARERAGVAAFCEWLRDEVRRDAAPPPRRPRARVEGRRAA
jgi:LysR family glycine cleavage system transcriptional activator